MNEITTINTGVNMTETETAESGLGQQASLDEVLQQNEKARAESQANSVFVTLEPSVTTKLGFTGKVYTRDASGTKDGKNWTAKKVDFELRAKTAQNQNKLWSISVKNPIVADIIRNFKAGIFDISVHREGKESATKYSISKERVV